MQHVLDEAWRAYNSCGVGRHDNVSGTLQQLFETLAEVWRLLGLVAGCLGSPEGGAGGQGQGRRACRSGHACTDTRAAVTQVEAPSSEDAARRAVALSDLNDLLGSLGGLACEAHGGFVSGSYSAGSVLDLAVTGAWAAAGKEGEAPVDVVRDAHVCLPAGVGAPVRTWLLHVSIRTTTAPAYASAHRRPCRLRRGRHCSSVPSRPCKAEACQPLTAQWPATARHCRPSGVHTL